MTILDILFLDIDGVLNSTEYSLSDRPTPEERSGVLGIDPVAVKRLNHVVSHDFYPLRIVVSSTKRHHRSMDDLDTMLRQRGFCGGPLLGKTPDCATFRGAGAFKERGDEIQAWLDVAPCFGLSVRSFAILDDDADMGHLSDRLVQTTFARGLEDVHVGRVLELLREPHATITLPTDAQLRHYGSLL